MKQKASALKLSESELLWKRGLKVTPAGTQTFSKGPSQYVDGVAPKYIQRGQGPFVWDVDGNKYIDYVLGLGPVILGHSHPYVAEAITKALEEGVALPLIHPLEIELSEKLIDIIPCAEMVRFGKNGSDVTAGAVRAARGFTGRDYVACCGYHGWQDWFIGSTTRNKGVPKATQELTLTFQYNNIKSLQDLFDKYPDKIAAVILEPTAFDSPQDNFLEKVKELTHKNKSILIFDEIITGFRLAMGGAQEYFQVIPDLATFGKAMANGMPISAVVGKKEIMQIFEDAFFSFTFGGEIVSIAAALATIEVMEKEGGIEKIASVGRQLIEGYSSLIREKSIEKYTKIIGYPHWPELLFYDHQENPSLLVQSLFQQEVVRRGILMRPGMMISASHTEDEVRATLQAFDQAWDVVKEAIEVNDVESKLEGKVVEPVIRSKG